MTVMNEVSPQMSGNSVGAPTIHTAVLDKAQLGDIRGAFGSIAEDDFAPRSTLGARLKTLLAILGPGLIVMVGDNDAGAFGIYNQAGQNYGTTLLWTLVLLIPVLYVNQERVLRLGAVTGVGHARLIFERFGKFWGAFSVIDLFILNALTIVTEFIGITLALDYLGLPKLWGVLAAAALVMLAASTGNFRRFERFALPLVAGSFLVFPVLLFIHPTAGQMIQDMMVPKMPEGAPLNEVMLLIIAIVGTTVAPWQLFFQQSYVVDKRIRPRFIKYERVDLTIAMPLIDACIIGAAAVSLATAYAMGDVFSWRHSLHRKPTEAKGFYAIYCGLIVLAAALVLTPGIQLGLLTSAVQTLAGVLLPGATVFLLLLCNDKAVLGPWVNSRRLNLFTGGVVAVLVMLSVILTGSVLYPGISDTVILSILIGGSVVGLVAALGAAFAQRRLRRLEPGGLGAVF